MRTKSQCKSWIRRIKLLLLLLSLFCFHIDYIINGIIVPEVQCQQDSSNFKNFPEDPSRMNDSGFLQLQYPGLNSNVFHSLVNIFWRCSQSPTMTGMIDSFIFHSFLISLARSWYFSFFFDHRSQQRQEFI